MPTMPHAMLAVAGPVDGENCMGFGARLRALRLAADLTQRELAQMAGLDYTYVSKIEAGVVLPPSPEKIRAIGAALRLDRVTIQELLALAQQTKVPTEEVNAALIRNPGIGALLRRLSNRRLTDKQIEALLQIIERALE